MESAEIHRTNGYATLISGGRALKPVVPYTRVAGRLYYAWAEIYDALSGKTRRRQPRRKIPRPDEYLADCHKEVDWFHIVMYQPKFRGGLYRIVVTEDCLQEYVAMMNNVRDGDYRYENRRVTQAASDESDEESVIDLTEEVAAPHPSRRRVILDESSDDQSQNSHDASLGGFIVDDDVFD